MRVYTCIVGDLFHYGHSNFLRQARELGNYLIVGVCGDEDCIKYKRLPILSEHERSEVIASCRYVDEILLSPPSVVTYEFIQLHQIDLVVHGDDSNEQQLMYFYGDAIRSGRYKSISYTSGISTTEIINRIQKRSDAELQRKCFCPEP